VHVSATSQFPAEARQTVLEERKESAGQTVLEPSHVSWTSHAPAEARHTVPLGAGPTATQTGAPELQSI